MAAQTRWVTDMSEGHSQWYIERFRKMAAEGADLGGEARLLDAMLPPGSRVLDAGCGPGRLGGVLHARGHTVVGVDADPALIDAAEVDHPGPRWLVADLAALDLPAAGEPEPFDGAVLAGNVMVFLAPGTETEVLRHVAAHVRPEGFIVVGFHVNRHLTLHHFDHCVRDAGLRVEHRFATWDLRAWHDDADFAVTVLRLGREHPPGLRGELVVLREPMATDLPDLVRIREAPEVHARWRGGDDLAAAVDQDLAEEGLVSYVIEVDGRVVGWIQWAAESDPDYRHAGIDLYLDPAVHGRGIGTDAVRTVARHLIADHGFHRLVIDPAADNQAAIRTYSKVGFRPVGVMRRYERGPDGTWHDGLLMELLADELT